MIYAVVGDNALLYDTTDVIDYICLPNFPYEQQSGNVHCRQCIQSLVGLIMVFSANLVVKKVDPDSAMF